jgi:hypothetical protein
MTKDEGRMTKEGRMAKVEGKGGSDFGFCDSFVFRLIVPISVVQSRNRESREGTQIIYSRPFASFAVQ